jgi:Short C-terminal domain
VVGPGGQDIPVAMQDGEVGNLAQALLSGDPAAKQAAMERIRNIKDQAQQQAPGGIGQPGQPTGFDQPGGFVQPGGFIQPDFGQPGGFTQPNIGQPPSPGPVGSFDTGMGQGTKHEQLARLQQLLDKGILTESEFEAQRQQVLGQS